MDRLLGIFPDAKFVHLIRDGIDVVHSWSRIEKYKGEVSRPARRWKSAVTAAQHFADKHLDRLLEVRHEELCRTPEETLKKVCQFVDLSYEPDMVSRTDHYDEMRKAQALTHYKNAFESISTDSIGKGRRNLSQPQKEKVAASIEDELVRQGYAPVQA